MKSEYKIMVLSILIGLFVWVLDTVIDLFIFYEGTFWGILIYDIPGHELYIRTVILALFILFGAFLARVTTKHKRAEKARRESEKDFRRFFNNDMVGITLTTLEGTLIRTNRAFACNILGYDSVDELTSRVEKEGLENVVYETPQRRKEIVDQALTDEKWRESESRTKRKDGTIIDARFMYQLVSSPDGEDNYLQGIVEDVTRQKREAEALLESERFANKILESSLNGIYIMDTEKWKNVYMNWVRLFYDTPKKH